MNKLKIHTIETAPNKSKESLKKSVKQFGMIPNLHGVLAEAPEVLEAYKTLHQLFSNTSFNNEELTVIWQTINVEHECNYCVPAHTLLAHKMKINSELITALRNRTEIQDEKLRVLQNTTLSILNNRGKISDMELQSFYKAGYNERHILEIILGISQKVISNYTNHIANTPLDYPFEKYIWKK